MKSEQEHSKTYKMTCAPSEDSEQLVYQRSLISVFAGRYMSSQGSKAPSGGKRRLWPDCQDVQADLSLSRIHTSNCRFCHAPVQLNGR